MAAHDRIHGGQGARRAASLYYLLVFQLFSSCSPSWMGRPRVAAAVAQVVNEYLSLLKEYMGPSETAYQSEPEDADEHSSTTDVCSECSEAYKLLESPHMEYRLVR